jgi:peptidoglycan/LPS O-acetylase OafA/YrhL
MQGSAHPDPLYYKGLDAWRGIAVLAVIVSHYFATSFICRFGWVGVDMFFVLSGFLITHSLLKSKKEPRRYFFNFYIRRILRIVPVYFALLACFYGYIYLSGKQDTLKFYVHNWWYYASFLQNWLFAFKGLPDEYVLNHLWSLAVEEQFYILWPFVLYFIPLRRLSNFLLIFIAVTLVLRTFLWLSFPGQIGVYYCNTFTRMDSICIGCFLASARPNIRKETGIILMIALSLSVFLGIILCNSTSYTSPFFATAGYTLLAFLFCLLLDQYIKSKKLGFLKNSFFLNYIGKISYCIYLIHVPVYLFIKAKLNYSTLLVVSISFAVTVLASGLSFIFLESKFLQLKRFFPVAGKPDRKTVSAVSAVET